MKKVKKLFFISALTILATACGGFSDMDDPTGAASLEGLALTAQGEILASVDVYLVRDGLAVLGVKTDEQGMFSMELDELGPVDIVVNDGAGLGSLKQMAVYEGANDAGRLFVQPLESISPVVDMRGVGFEERVTSEGGDYIDPKYNSDRSAVFAARKLGGSANYEIVRIDLPMGQETVLIDDVDLVTSYTEEIQLLDDRVLQYRATMASPENPETLTQGLVLIDTSSGQKLLEMPWWQMFSEAWVAGDDICYFDGYERQQAFDTLFGWAYEYQVRPVRINLTTGQQELGATLSGWKTGSDMWIRGGHKVAFRPQRDCDYEDPNCSWDPLTSIYMTDFANLTTSYIGDSGDAYSFALYTSWNGQAIFFLHNLDVYEQAIMRMDVSTGQVSTLRTIEAGDGSIYRMTLSPDNSELLLDRRVYEGTHFVAGAVSRMALSDNSLTPLSLNHTAGSDTFTLCQGEYSSCIMSYLDDSLTVRITETFDLTSQRAGALVDFTADGSAVARLFPIGEGDYQVPRLLTSPDSSIEALRLRNLDTGFFQLLTGPAGTPADQMQPQTFITANHSTMAFSEDGTYLFYFTRDPISGYTQLFRVENTE